MRYAKNLPAQAVVPQETNGRAGMEGASPAPVDSSTPSSRETTPACQDAGTTSMFGSLGRVWNSVVQTSKHRLLFSWGTNPNLTAQEANPNKVKVIKSEPANPNDPNL